MIPRNPHPTLAGAPTAGLVALCAALAIAGSAAAAEPASPPPAPAAERPPAEVVAEAMTAVDFLVGRWRGAGSFRMGPGEPQAVDVVELVQSKLGGRVLLLEGLGTVPAAAGGGAEGGAEAEPRVVHEALGVLSYDPAEDRYLMRAFTREGRWVDARVEVGDRRLVWGFTTPGGEIRYTLRLDEEGRWHEVGEIHRQGQWMPFFEMRLARAGG